MMIWDHDYYAIVFAIVQLLDFAASSGDRDHHRVSKRRAPVFVKRNGASVPTVLNAADFERAERYPVPDQPFSSSRYLKNPSFVEGDILGFTSESFMEFVKERRKLWKLIKSGRLANSAARDTSKHWPGGIVPYVISSHYSQDARAKIAEAIREYHSRTCIRFVPRSNQVDYVMIESQGPYTCASVIGKQGGMQKVLLGAKCFQTGTIVHELMHAVGFFHEQSRPDRDEYVIINWENIQPNTQQNFEKYPPAVIDILGTPYDYGSVMHYGSDYFSRNGGLTVIPRKPVRVPIGQRRGFSEVDVQRLNILYKCDMIKPPPGPGAPQPPGPFPPQPIQPITQSPFPGGPLWPPQPQFCDYCQSCVGCQGCIGCENCLNSCLGNGGTFFPRDEQNSNEREKKM